MFLGAAPHTPNVQVFRSQQAGAQCPLQDSASPQTHFPLLNTSKVFQCFLKFSYREQSVGNAQGNLGNNQLSLNHQPHILWESPLSLGMSQGILPGPFPASHVLCGKADKIPNTGTALLRNVLTHPEAGGDIDMGLFELLHRTFTPRTCDVPQTRRAKRAE